jgi:putative tricarboxylic transport membrane protein
MAQQGKAGLAIGAAAGASTIGGIFGLVILVLILPVAKAVVLWFGPPAFFMMALLGLTCLTVTGSNVLRGLISGCVGLFLGFVGYDSIGGTERYTGGVDYLWDGIPLVPVLIGLFAITEMISLYVSGGPVSKANAGAVRITGIWEGVRESFRHLKVVLSSSAIGTVLGSIPGVGGTVGSFMAYSFTAQLSRDNQNFGRGDIRGVIAPEAANNAKDGGSLIPTLAFGIPGGAEMALFLGVLILHGLNPGPMLLIEREYTIFTLIITILAATILSNIVVLLTTRFMIKIAYIDSAFLVPSVIAISLVGAFTLRGSLGDVFTAAFFGLLGYLMLRFDYARITLVIALVLSELMERNYTQSMLMFDGDWTGFFRDNTAFVLFLITLTALFVPAVQAIRRK